MTNLNQEFNDTSDTLLATDGNDTVLIKINKSSNFDYKKNDESCRVGRFILEDCTSLENTHTSKKYNTYVIFDEKFLNAYGTERVNENYINYSPTDSDLVFDNEEVFPHPFDNFKELEIQGFIDNKGKFLTNEQVHNLINNFYKFIYNKKAVV